MHEKRFPNESSDYRTARDHLLEEEMKLRQHLEQVAALRRQLPLGGKIPQDYEFECLAHGSVEKVPLSSLFMEDKNTLLIYNMMYHPEDADACPSCTSIIDALDGESPHVNDKVNLVVVCKAPIGKLSHWAMARSWHRIPLLSSFNNTFNKDYLAENENGEQMPMLNVFQKTQDGVFHFWGSELLYVPSEDGQDGRHVDLIWPLWNLFDVTPEGRGSDWYPRNSYH